MSQIFPIAVMLPSEVRVSWKIGKVIFFCLSGFSSQTHTIHRTAGEGRGPSFFPLYHFHPLTNNETFICNFACEWLSHIFNRNACVYQIATRWDLPPYRITIWVIDWWCHVCLFTWWIDTRFCYSDLTLETGEFEPTSTITFVLQTKRLTKCASHRSTITLVLQANLLTKSVDKGKAMNRYQATRKYKK